MPSTGEESLLATIMLEEEEEEAADANVDNDDN
jgi:hypothetical protein